MKLLTLIGFVAAVLFPGTATAQPKDAAIVVVAQPVTVAQWSKATARKLDDKLRYPRPLFNEVMAAGIVSVRFRAGEAGQPVAVTLSRTSGTRELDRAAMRAISGIRTLGPMPISFGLHQQFVANILFATNEDEADRLRAAFRRQAPVRVAQLPGEAVPIALSISSHASVGS